ncbi:MAG: 50S ribosomal protein L4 [Phycisphaerales bacterium]
MEVPVLNMQGKQVGTIKVDEMALGGEVIPALLKQAYVRYHANQRQGSARTKNRGRVEGSTRKLYKQKHTGNARAGTVRTNLRKGGGRAFAKLKERVDYRLDMPIKMRRKANRNALLAKLIDNEVKVIDSLAFSTPKTSAFKEMLGALGIDRTCLIAINAENDGARKAARNLEHVNVCNSAQLTCWDMLNNRYMVITKADLEAWISGPSSKTGKSAKADKKETK